MKLLLDKGVIPYEGLESSIHNFCISNEIHLITEKCRKNQWHANTNIQYHYYDDLASNPVSIDYYSEYDNLVKSLLNDSRTLFLLERVTRDYIISDSLFNKSSIIANYAYNSLKLLKTCSIDTLLFQATPHHINSWILAKTAELLKLKILIIQSFPIPGRYWVVEGLDSQKPKLNLFDNRNEEDQAFLNAYILKLKGDYNDAIPTYEKQRLESRKGKFWSWKHEIRLCLNDPRKFLVLNKKRNLYSHYENLAFNAKTSTKYFVFFLHYQPERTSLPEGYHYYQQLFLIRQLAMSLPVGYELIVKEHPSTFTGVYDPRYRNKEFYNSINSIQNVKCVSLNQNSFELIDKSTGVISITGTVGIEALLRGKQVYTFGVASYRIFGNVYNIKNDDLKLSLEKMMISDPVIVKKEVRKNLESFINHTIGNNQVQGNWYAPEIRLQCHNTLLKIILEDVKMIEA